MENAEHKTASEREVEWCMSRLAEVTERLEKYRELLGPRERAHMAAQARKLLGTQHTAKACEKLEAINGTVQPCRSRPDGSGCVWCGKPC